MWLRIENRTVLKKYSAAYISLGFLSVVTGVLPFLPLNIWASYQSRSTLHLYESRLHRLSPFYRESPYQILKKFITLNYFKDGPKQRTTQAVNGKESKREYVLESHRHLKTNLYSDAWGQVIGRLKFLRLRLIYVDPQYGKNSSPFWCLELSGDFQIFGKICETLAYCLSIHNADQISHPCTSRLLRHLQCSDGSQVTPQHSSFGV